MHDASIHYDFDTLQNKVKIVIVDYNIYYKMKNIFTTDFIDFTHVHVFSNWARICSLTSNLLMCTYF
jgi:hypothetical protein